VAATLRGDSVRLRQILFNLLGNAIKFTPKGQVDVGVTVVEQNDAGQTLEMTVEDTGIGIAPDVLPQLFETYMQADATIQARFGGTGIGLALTRKFSVLLGGQIAASSRPGEGSCFTIDIPADLKVGRQGDDPRLPQTAAADPPAAAPTAHAA
jgi:hypothetical protein